MPALFLVSTEPLTGKTALIGSLGLRLRASGRRLGYLKPAIVDTGALDEASVADSDRSFIREALGLTDPQDAIVTAVVTHTVSQDLLAGEAEDFAAKLKYQFSELSRGREVVFVEGGHTLSEGAMAGVSASEAARLLDLSPVLVARYREEGLADDVLGAREALGGRLPGVVINMVPSARMDFVSNVLAPFLGRHGVGTLAVLPEVRELIGMSVREIADYLEGQIITNEDRSGDLVESMMIGAMSIDSGVGYYERKENKVVIVAANRPDLTFPAFETSTRAVVLTGGLSPHPALVARSEESGIPLILVGPETFPVVESMEMIFGRTRASHLTKLQRFGAVFEQNADMPAWASLLGAPL